MPLSRKRLSHVLRTVIIVAVVSAVSCPLYKRFESPIRDFLGMDPPPHILSFDVGEYRVKLVDNWLASDDVYVSGPNDVWMRKTSYVSAYDFSRGSFYRPGDTDFGGPPQGKPVFSKDINSDGWPEVIIMDDCGGTSGRADCYVLRLGKKIDGLLELPDTRPGGLQVLDEDRDGNLEVFAGHDPWSSWPGEPCIDIPVVYKWQSGTYSIVAPEPYAKYALVIEAITRACLQTLKKSGNAGATDSVTSTGYPSVHMWEIMLDCVYLGEGVMAREAFDRFWPAGIEGKDEALIEFDQRLRKSRFWDEINAVTAPEKRWPEVKAPDKTAGD